METVHTPVIDALRNPALYPHPCMHVELVETHISWVLLTGLRAYKIKKPVDLGFVNFTSLDRRRHFCEEELRLNRRLAPELYLDVVPITGTADRPEIGGTGTVLEYAVRMLQFEQRQLLSRLPPDELEPVHIDSLADCCADFLSEATVAERGSVFGTPAQIMQPVRDNFEVLKHGDESLKACVATLEQRAELQFARLNPIFADRKRDGMIRECHGDLHLGNMFLNHDQIVVFDGIEFSDELRWIDIINDIAFAVMDFADRGRHNLARRFLNRWLERTGDYSGLSVLPFYCAYRAAVRAKIDAIRMQQPSLSFSDQRHLSSDCRGYLELALRYTVGGHPALIITMGPSGSGKTMVTQRLIEATDTIRIRSDVERKRLFGLRPEESSRPELKMAMYAAEATARTYDRLAELAGQVIDAGFPVVVDATFLYRSERARFAQLARRLRIPFLIIKCEAAEATLQDRIRQRHQQAGDASEADTAVLRAQLRSIEPLSAAEEQSAVNSTSEHLTTAVTELVSG